jgi:hypothetical protein
VRSSFILAAALAALLPAQTRRAPEVLGSGAASALPPVSYACPMHPDVIDDKPGSCPRCRMALEPVRLGTAYSCPVHTFVLDEAPGRCRVCRRELVPVTVSLWFTCANSASERAIDPGVCSDGAFRSLTRERRAHGDHNPRHEGQFFMASDNWHHLEGTYRRPGIFRVYLYDDFTRPLAPGKLREARGTATVGGAGGAAVSRATEIPLAVSTDGRALEARIGSAPPAMPISVTLRLAFTPGAAKQRFDFSFSSYTAEADLGSPLEVPETARTAGPANSLLDELAKQRRALDAAVASGAYGAAYIPALEAKDVALRIEAAASQANDKRPEIAAAVKRIVVAAWLLDSYGDLGDREKIEQARAAFDDAVDAVFKAHDR